MAGRRRAVLGVDINPHEIRLVELTGTPEAPTIRVSGSVPTPEGSMDADRITNAGAIGAALRGLVERLQPETREAVLGISDRAVITRVLDIPNVPDGEVRTVIDGELAHYRILREGAGAFDFARLPAAEAGQKRGPQALVMAIENSTASLYRDIAERAGLTLVALEPLLFAMYRAAFPAATQSGGSALCLSVGYGRTDVTIVQDGQIRLYRQVDIGTDRLLASREGGPFNSAGTFQRFLMADGETLADGEANAGPGEIDRGAGQDLANEIQRSLQYYRREVSDTDAVDRMVVATHDPEAAGLGLWLSEVLGLQAVTAAAPDTADDPSGMKYLAATGLAAQQLAGGAAGVPSFDLSVAERAVVAAQSGRQKLALALAGSVAILALGIAGSLALGRKANGLGDEVARLQTDLQNKQRLQQARAEDIERRMQDLGRLRLEGFPFPRMMDATAAAVDPGAGLREVVLDNSGSLRLVGDAQSEQAIIRTLETLKTIPYFEGAALQSFQTVVPNDAKSGLQFEITARVAGVQRPVGVQTAAAAP
jgi:type IV pilus assembly protein PilM